MFIRLIMRSCLATFAVLTAAVFAILAATPGEGVPLTVIKLDAKPGVAGTLYRFADGDLQPIMSLEVGEQGFAGPQMDFVWSPDGAYLLYQTVQAVNGYFESEIWIAHPDTGQSQALVRGYFNTGERSWSLDGRRILADTDSGSFIQTINDDASKLVLDGTTLGDDDIVAVRQAIWSPREPNLLAAVLQYTDGPYRLVLIDVDEGVRVHDEVLSSYVIMDELAWLPHGQALTYRITPPAHEGFVRSRYLQVDLSTREPQPLTRHFFEPISIAWTPSADRVAMVEPHQDGNRLHVINPKTDTITRTYVADDTVVFRRVTWSPDGRMLAVDVRDESLACTITLIDTDRNLQVQPFAYQPGECRIFTPWR